MISKTKSCFVFAIFSVLALVLVSGFATADTIFFDGFESGNLNDWTVTSGANGEWEAIEDESTSNTDQWHAEAINTDSLTILERTIDTTGFDSIVFSYSRQLGAEWDFGFAWFGCWVFCFG